MTSHSEDYAGDHARHDQWLSEKLRYQQPAGEPDALVTIIEEVLAEHAMLYHGSVEVRQYRCACGGEWLSVADHAHAQVIHRAHQAEQVAARLGIEERPAAVLADDGSLVPVIDGDDVFPDDIGLHRVHALEGSDAPTR